MAGLSFVSLGVGLYYLYAAAYRGFPPLPEVLVAFIVAMLLAGWI